MFSFYDIPSSIWADIALFSGSTALIEVASWIILPEHWPIVRFIANGSFKKNLNNVSRSFIESLPAYCIDPLHWIQYGPTLTESYISKICLDPCYNKINELLNAGIINPIYFFSSETLLSKLCYDPTFADFYCAYLKNAPHIRKEASIHYYKMGKCVFVRHGKILEALHNTYEPYHMYDIIDINCFQRWYNETDTKNYSSYICSYPNALNMLFRHNELDLMLAPHLKANNYNITLTFHKNLNIGAEDIAKLKSIMAKFNCIIQFILDLSSDDMATKSIIYYHELGAQINITTDDNLVFKLKKNNFPNAFKVARPELHHIVSAVIDTKLSHKFNKIALSMLQHRSLSIKETNGLIYELSYTFEAGQNHPMFNHLFSWLYHQYDSNNQLKNFAQLILNSKLELRFPKIVLAWPSIEVPTHNRDIDKLREHKLISHTKYIEEKLLRCSALEFEDHFNKWSPHGQEELIGTTLYESVHINHDKVRAIISNPALINAIPAKDWHFILDLNLIINNAILPIHFELLYITIIKLAQHDADIIFNSKKGINLAIAIHKSFILNEGPADVRKALKRLIPDQTPKTIIENLPSDIPNLRSVALIVMSFVYGHKYEDYKDIPTEHEYSLEMAALIAFKRMPSFKTVYIGHIPINKYFISIIDPQICY